MLKVLTAEQMREVDRLTTEHYGIPSIILMENAAHAVARVITEKLGGSVKGKSILILCGPGNNGGDGAALGRILWQQKADVSVVLVGSTREAKGDAQVQFDAFKRLAGAGTPFIDYWELADGDLRPLKASLVRSGLDLIVDAMFGTGLNRPLDKHFQLAAAQAEQWSIAMHRVPVLSIDLPSGLNADDQNPIDRSHVRADWTVTFTAPKLANVLPPNNRVGGELTVGQIGSPDDLIDLQPSQLFLAQAADATLWLLKSRFTDFSYKNKRGHALIIAGSKNYTGAAVLCGDAAIRSGCGLVTIATPEGSRESIVARVSPEVMVRGISETPDGSAAEKAVDEVKEFLKNVDVIAVGSGLSSKEDETKTFVRRIVEDRTTPVVIDADGLTALSPWTIDGRAGGTPAVQSSPLVLTPHEGEFRKMLGVEKEEFDELIKDRVAAVRDFAKKHNVVLVLKGERGLIGHPDGRVVVNPTGNSGLGKAGNGDTLTGIITGFIAQAVQMKIDIFETVVAAVYIAGLAGDVAEKKFGKRVMTASDVRECMVDVFEELAK